MFLRLTIIVISFFLLSSCATYYSKIRDYHQYLAEGNYQAAEKSLVKTKFLKKDRNKVLLYLELGKTRHLQGDYDSSNYYFNLADTYMEENTKKKDLTKELLVNQASVTYKGEDFERVLIHYYKALNYYYLGKREDAIVEARRITLKQQELDDKHRDDKNKYDADAFSYTMQGLLYEVDNDYNNAFISYRQAYELYARDKKDSSTYMGTKLPEQLKHDLVRTAQLAGFSNERIYYENLLRVSYTPDTSRNGYLVFIWENGLAPVKQQEDIFCTLVPGLGGQLYFTDKSGDINIPFIIPSGTNSDLKFNEIGMLRVAYPRYETQLPLYQSAEIVQDSTTRFLLEPAENINYIAFKTLRERRLKELGVSFTRLAIKKATEIALKNTKGDSTQVAIASAIGTAVGLASFIMEKADTRNWQSLPYDIQYVKIPLHKGTNTFTMTMQGQNGTKETRTFSVEANGKLQLMNYANLSHIPGIVK